MSRNQLPPIGVLFSEKRHGNACYAGYLQKGRVKLRFGGRQSNKSRWNYFESLQGNSARN